MCGRFTIMLEPEELRQQLELGELPVEFAPNNNVSPGQAVPVVINPVTRDVEMFKWGLVPRWTKDPKIGYKMFNARAETISEKPSFRIPFLRQRCLILANGFYEWKIESDHKYPFLFTLKERKPFTFAGLWDSWRDKEGIELRSCTIITIEPNSLMVEYHNRMPVILGETTRWKWLENTQPEELKSLLLPYASEEMDTPLRIET